MKQVIAVAALAVAVAGYVSPVHASSIQPGANCQAVGQNSNSLNYTTSGQVGNAAGLPVKIVCPITRENVAEGWSSVSAVVSDRHSTQDISCDAVSAQTDGAGYAITRVSTQFSPEWYQSETLNFAAPTFVRSGGTFYLVCTLPPAEAGRQSTLASYSVTERCVSWITSTGYGGKEGHYHSVGMGWCE